MNRSFQAPLGVLTCARLAPKIAGEAQLAFFEDSQQNKIIRLRKKPRLDLGEFAKKEKRRKNKHKKGSMDEHKIAKSSVREAVSAGFKTAAISGTIAAVPTLVGCRVIPWAKANLNYTAQALIISAASIAGFFITADRSILNSARGNTIGKYDKNA